MKKWLVFMLVILPATLASQEVFGENNTFFESVKFIQYLDENTALEEVRNGNIDAYFYRISSDRLENPRTREGLQVFDSTGGSYSILMNPAKSEKFNPFSSQEIRYAINFLIDRKLIVNELMGGYGSPTISYYGPSDPEYLTVIQQIETFNFEYNPAYAKQIIKEALKQKGAINQNGKWYIDSNPIEITIFIRNDDPIRKSIGEILADEFEEIGFSVKKEFGDLNKAFVVVYGSNPADLKWNLYTEGWTNSAFVKYNSVGLGQMYAPWFSNMPGFNDPTYWNYNNEKLDELTQKIYTGDFDSYENRNQLIQEAVVEGINESIRIFLASKTDQYVVNEEINGIINDFGAGVPTRFTPINARSDDSEFVIGVKQIYQGAWNPVMGITDNYSKQIWGIISDPGTFKHPFTGETFPIRENWTVETNGVNEKLTVPQSAIIWNPHNQKWEKVAQDTLATSKVTFDYEFSNWHNGQEIDMNDILHSLYFTIEWGTQIDEKDRTFDSEFTPRAAQSIKTIIGINPIDENSIEVYVDYWHFDKGEIAEWASLWSSVPWEITSAMEKAVMEGKVSFSRSGSTSKNINWLSLILPNDSSIIKEYLKDFKKTNYIPASLHGIEEEHEYFQNRYEASINWIENYNHAVISNGPFFLDSYSPGSRTILVKTFEDKSYPFKAGTWSDFEKIEYPVINKVEMNEIIQQGNNTEIIIKTKNAQEIRYFLTNNVGELKISKSIKIDEDETKIELSKEETQNLGVGANNIKIFALSERVLKPDFYESGFLVTEKQIKLPTTKLDTNEVLSKNTDYTVFLIVIPIIVTTGIIIYLKKNDYAKPKS